MKLSSASVRVVASCQTTVAGVQPCVALHTEYTICRCTNELRNMCDALAVVLVQSTVAHLVRTGENWPFQCENLFLCVAVVICQSGNG